MFTKFKKLMIAASMIPKSMYKIVYQSQQHEKMVQECKIIWPDKINHSKNIKMIAVELLNWDALDVAYKLYYHWLSGDDIDRLEYEYNIHGTDYLRDGIWRELLALRKIAKKQL
jgi:hypothetical protein